MAGTQGVVIFGGVVPEQVQDRGERARVVPDEHGPAERLSKWRNERPLT